MYEEYITRRKRLSNGRQILYLDIEDFKKTGFWTWILEKLSGCPSFDREKMEKVSDYLGKNPTVHTRFTFQQYYLCVGNRVGTKWEQYYG